MKTSMRDFRVMKMSFNSELEFLEFQNLYENDIEITSFRQDYRMSSYCSVVMNVRKESKIYTDRLKELTIKSNEDKEVCIEDIPF